MSRFEAALQEAHEALDAIEKVKTVGDFVVKERFNGKWLNSYFDNEPDAKKLCMKIIAKGGCAVWMKNGN